MYSLTTYTPSNHLLYLPIIHIQFFATHLHYLPNVYLFYLPALICVNYLAFKYLTYLALNCLTYLSSTVLSYLALTSLTWHSLALHTLHSLPVPTLLTWLSLNLPTWPSYTSESLYLSGTYFNWNRTLLLTGIHILYLPVTQLRNLFYLVLSYPIWYSLPLLTWRSRTLLNSTSYLLNIHFRYLH